MKKILTLILGLMLMTPVVHADQPYDETANAVADIKAALKTAGEQNKHVIAIFGANWCPYCRSLAKALDGDAGAKLAQDFVVVKIDVGQWDKNMDLVEAYGDPLGDGLPGAAVIGADDKPIFTAKADELINAVEKGEDALSALFKDGID
jgi:protein disulfide-isomerase